jgi:hypothetical protein
MDPFKWFMSGDFREWGMTVAAKTEFPRIIARMIRATASAGTVLHFPAGRDAFVGGWDGQVLCPAAADYVPEGISLWELGAERDHIGKADEEYRKRSNKPLSYSPAKCTFVFVTPNFWQNKDQWRAEKLKEGVWKDIRVLDCRDLEEWIAHTPAIAWHLATITRRMPAGGVRSGEDFLRIYTCQGNGKRLQLDPSVVTCGREFQTEELRKYLAAPADAIKAVKASSREEAIAFIIAAAKQFEIQESEHFFARSLIVENKESFRIISNNRFGLNLIAQLEEKNELSRGILDGHHVLLPLGPDDTFNSNDIIILPRPDSDGLTKALLKSGIEEDAAVIYVKNSGHNITILKKQLGFPQDEAQWAAPMHKADILPALLVGKWNEDKSGDISIVAELAGQSYEQYIEKLAALKASELPFIYQIGMHWRLASPLDAWTRTSAQLMRSDLEKLEKAFLDVLGTVPSLLDLDSKQRPFASLLGKENRYSYDVREGLCQSLVLVALYGTNLSLPMGDTGQHWVNHVIHMLLSSADGRLWKSLHHEMPLIAEAAPQVFLDLLAESLSHQQPAVMAMFTEEPGLIMENSYHPGLLWALEALAWIPEYLSGATANLARLHRFDPGGKIVNRPINTLRNIFLPWLPQTNATVEQRHNALQWMVDHEAATAWSLLLSLLHKPHDVAHPTVKTRWRLFQYRSQTEGATYEDIYRTYHFCVDALIRLAGTDPDKLATLVDISELQLPEDRLKILDIITQQAEQLKGRETPVWHELRKVLHFQRSHPDSQRSLPEPDIQRYAALYEQLTPDNIIDRYKWLFNDNWPKLAEGHNRKESDNNESELIEEERLHALQQIYQAMGLSTIQELTQELLQKQAIGKFAASIILDNAEVVQYLSEALLTEKDLLPAAQTFVYWKHRTMGWGYIHNLFEILQLKKYAASALANFLQPIPPAPELWRLLETLDQQIQELYWQYAPIHLHSVNPVDAKYVINKLLDAGRGLTAIDELNFFVEQFEFDFIEQVLRRAITSQEERHFPTYELGKIFESLAARQDLDKGKLTMLEWAYFPVLQHSYDHARNLELYKHLGNSPEFFVDLLKLVYSPETEAGEINQEREEEREQKSRRETAYELLHEYPGVPGLREDGILDAEHLTIWVNESRALAQAADRLEAADSNIGRILSQYPETKEGQWPPDAICAIIDGVNTRFLKSGFKAGTFNKRGSYSKNPYEGGKRERGIATYFQGLADPIVSKWPATARILQQLAEEYRADAHREDERAEREKLDR